MSFFLGGCGGGDECSGIGIGSWEGGGMYPFAALSWFRAQSLKPSFFFAIGGGSSSSSCEYSEVDFSSSSFEPESESEFESLSSSSSSLAESELSKLVSLSSSSRSGFPGF